MNDTIIRKALRANAIFSAAAGAGLAVLAIPLSEVTGAPRLVLAAIGVGLLPWGLMLWRFAGRDQVRPVEGWLAVAGDEAWVIGTVLILVLHPSALTVAGKVLAGAVGLVVAGLSVAQIVGLRRLSHASRQQAAIG